MEPQTWLVRLVIYGLAVYRTTRLFVYEEGPSRIFERLRTKARVNLVHYTSKDESSGEWFTEKTEKRILDGFFGGLLTCPLCLSVWFSAIAAICLYLKKTIFDVVATGLALSAVATILFNQEGEE